MLITGGIIAGLIASTAIWFLFFAPQPAAPNPEPIIESTFVPPPEPIYSPLTGLETTEENAKRPITAVMIENSVDARPQAGLQEAGVVYEAIAEGGITRFLAVYQESRPEHIGPIRSARPYYVRWAAGYDAGYVHSGGSGEALSLIRALNIKDLDHGTYGERLASRVNNRFAPHNVYTSMNRIDELRNSLGFTTSTFTGFARPDPDAELIPPTTVANTITFTISSPLYNTSYTYNPESNTYKRTMANQPHIDERSGKQITPSVVIALVMGYRVHPNGIHSIYDSIGSGKALIFQNGGVTEAAWIKETDSAPLLIRDAAGVDLPLQAGQTWITAIPDGRVNYTP